MSTQSLIGAQDNQSTTTGASPSLISPQTHQLSLETAEESGTGSHIDVSSSKGALPFINGGQTIQTNTAEALKKEALSLRKQVESIKRERAAMEIEVDSLCGPGAPCRARLEAMEVAHQKALQELQEKHEREIRELEEERDRMLQDERRAVAKAVEALRTAHREELERVGEKARRLSGGAASMDTSYRGHMPQADVLHSELDVLSQHYSQKCLELSCAEQSSNSQVTELGRKEIELEQLRRENQELKAKLAEETSRLRYFITGQKSDMALLGNSERTTAEVEILLRAKENEVQYLKKEISCLQNEVQCLKKEKEAAYERYKEAYVELSDTKGRNQLKMGSLNEHLRLASAALQEGTRQQGPDQ
uniref:Uncharacterized protein n=1 Tax=Monopterus albus TaxID=43700 RepID=A0A3Q3KDD5_MONAL|nr:TRIO and F-actin-binding protein-like [Monopterus albus]